MTHGTRFCIIILGGAAHVFLVFDPDFPVDDHFEVRRIFQVTRHQTRPRAGSFLLPAPWPSGGFCAVLDCSGCPRICPRPCKRSLPCLCPSGGLIRPAGAFVFPGAFYAACAVRPLRGVLTHFSAHPSNYTSTPRRALYSPHLPHFRARPGGPSVRCQGPLFLPRRADPDPRAWTGHQTDPKTTQKRAPIPAWILSTFGTQARCFFCFQPKVAA